MRGKQERSVRGLPWILVPAPWPDEIDHMPEAEVDVDQVSGLQLRFPPTHTISWGLLPTPSCQQVSCEMSSDSAGILSWVEQGMMWVGCNLSGPQSGWTFLRGGGGRRKPEVRGEKPVKFCSIPVLAWGFTQKPALR